MTDLSMNSPLGVTPRRFWRRSGPVWLVAAVLVSVLALMPGVGQAQSSTPAEGVLDTSFGNSGFLGVNWQSSAFDAAPVRTNLAGMVQQGDGRLLVVGTQYYGSTADNDSYVFLARLLANGSLDNSFGDRGGVLVSTRGGTRGDHVAVASDGKIVVGGGHYSGLDDTMFVWRFLADGSPDTSFGDGGSVSSQAFNDSGGTFEFNALSVQSDAKILFATSIGKGDFAGAEWTVGRFNADGSVDYSFGCCGGVFKTTAANPGGFSQLTSMLVQPDGKIVLGGNNGLNGQNFAVMRIMGNGFIDITFGRPGCGTDCDGIVFTDISGDDTVEALAYQPDGKIIAGGISKSPSALALVRYNWNGSLDTSFGNNGKVTLIDGGSPHAQSHGVTEIALFGRQIVAVSHHIGSGGTWSTALARFNGDGTVDTQFGNFNNQSQILPIAQTSTPHGVVVQRNGKIIVADTNRLFGVRQVLPSDNEFSATLRVHGLGGGVKGCDNAVQGSECWRSVVLSLDQFDSRGSVHELRSLRLVPSGDYHGDPYYTLEAQIVDTYGNPLRDRGVTLKLNGYEFPLGHATFEGSTASWGTDWLFPSEDSRFAWYTDRENNGFATAVSVELASVTTGIDLVYVYYDSSDEGNFPDWRWRSSTEASWGLKALVPPRLEDGARVSHVKLRPVAARSGSTIEVGQQRYDANGNEIPVSFAALESDGRTRVYGLAENKIWTFFKIRVTNGDQTAVHTFGLDPPPTAATPQDEVIPVTQTVTEGDPVDITARLAHGVAPAGGITYKIEANGLDQHGQATGAQPGIHTGDYPRSVTIPEGETSKIITITTVDDDRHTYRGHRVLNVIFTPDSQHPQAVTHKAKITINDNDPKPPPDPNPDPKGPGPTTYVPSVPVISEQPTTTTDTEPTPLPGVLGDHDTDADGELSLSEVLTAAQKYRNGEISKTDLEQIIRHYLNN